MQIITVGYCAAEAQKRIMELKGGELEIRFPSFFMRSAREAVQLGPTPPSGGAVYFARIGEGGIFSALRRMGEALNTGLEVDIKKIPVRQETIEILELYDLNPYYALSESAYLVVPEQAETYLETLRKMKTPAAVIGSLTPGPGMLILNGERVRYLDREQPEELLKIPGAYPFTQGPA